MRTPVVQGAGSPLTPLVPDLKLDDTVSIAVERASFLSLDKVGEHRSDTR